MRILVLGGTQFVGRHIVLEALSRGHQVSTFTRGRTPDDLPDAVERLHGDRDGDMTALGNRDWDAVVDVSGYVPRVVRASAELLRDHTRRYLFISTISVYEDLAREGVSEDDALARLADPAVEQVTGETYGGLKVLCEEVVREVYGERATIVRPGLIVGPHDHTDRFTFWAHHLARDERFVLFGDASTPLQLIDARDLAAFTLTLVERDTPGVFNAVGERRAWGDLVEDVRGAEGRVAHVTFH
ncbi:NAD-dependent epimerase/dehydratase family protein, partial [Deinococcus pimensis]|uniref:NAD-dependent epimerase/dehydratase family protein n=1 Tax=Deinococcus pimensis TaxID=309888 RepID=UPI000693B56E